MPILSYLQQIISFCIAQCIQKDFSFVIKSCRFEFFQEVIPFRGASLFNDGMINYWQQIIGDAVENLEQKSKFTLKINGKPNDSKHFIIKYRKCNIRVISFYQIIEFGACIG